MRGKVFYFTDYFANSLRMLILNMSNEGTPLGDPKDKRPHILRSEKCQKELEARGKLAQLYVGALGATSGVDKSTEEFKDAVFQTLYTWFRNRLYTHIKRNYLALGEVVGKEAFQSQMHRLFENAISGDRWNEERRNFGCSS
jgi:hypothetical protein